MFDYNEIKEVLKKNIATVEFTKKNGDHRIMKATLIDELLPEIKGTGKTDISEDVVKCFDTEANGWRSFRVDSVIALKI
jgi:hypothetical protein